MNNSTNRQPQYLLFVILALITLTGSLKLKAQDKQIVLVPGTLEFIQKANCPFTISKMATYGCSLVDYDGDGLDDLLLLNPGTNDLIYHNEGNGVFRQVENKTVSKNVYPSSGISWADYDNDGLPEFFVAVMGSPNVMFKFNGKDNFTEIKNSIAVGRPSNSFHASWVDYDNDGWLDLYVSNLNVFYRGPGAASFLYHNLGDGNFEQITDNQLVNDLKNSFCGNWADYDNDGLQDIYTLDLGKENSLYKNNGDGSFSKVPQATIEGDTAFSIACNWGDYNNDGFLDLFVANGGFRNEKNYLLKNNGDGSFTRILDGDLVSREWDDWNGLWGDFDNDGDLDLLEIPIKFDQVIHINNGDGTFTMKKLTSGAPDACSASLSDINNDGFLDIFMTEAGGPDGNFLFINKKNNNNWIEINCKGVVSNYSAIGTRLKIKANINGKPVWQIREISGCNGFRSQNSLRVHFGLGNAVSIDSLIVLWPSKQKTVLTNIKANQVLNVSEEMPDHYLRPKFEVSATKGVKSLKVKFTDKSIASVKNSITSWAWDFNGDGKIDSRVQNPEFNFITSEDRYFSPSLTISDGKISKTITKKNLILMDKSEIVNYALGKTATCSSTENDQLTANLAIDGELNTRWSSKWEDPQWLIIDLGKVNTFNYIRLVWEGAFAKTYKIEISDNKNEWETIFNEENGDGNVDEISVPGTSARYIRIYGTSRVNQYGYSLFEVEVLNRLQAIKNL